MKFRYFEHSTYLGVPMDGEKSHKILQGVVSSVVVGCMVAGVALPMIIGNRRHDFSSPVWSMPLHNVHLEHVEPSTGGSTHYQFDHVQMSTAGSAPY